MNIHLTPEQEEIVKDELKSGHFDTAEQVIAKALQVFRKQETLSGVKGEQRDAVKEMLAFAEQNRTSLEGVTVKDLIHEGHRL